MSHVEIDDDTQGTLKSLYTLVYAKQILYELRDVAEQKCYGCEVGHPSQIQHSCLMMSDFEKLETYFLDALEKVDMVDVLYMWKQEVLAYDMWCEEKQIKAINLYENSDFLKKNSPSAETLKSELETLLTFEHRFI